jgi:thymidylate synthase (FAD)
MLLIARSGTYTDWHLGVEDHLPAARGKGYRWHPKARKWAAQVTYQGVLHYLGLFVEEEGARQAVADFRSTHPSWRIRKLSSVRRNHARSVDEGTLLASRAGIADVVETGVKALTMITTVTGKSLSCAADQGIFTPDGFRLVRELVVGDQLMVSAKTVLPSERLIPPPLRAGIGVWTSMQRNRLISERDTCHICLRIFAREDLVLDHVVPVVIDLLKALDRTNLKPACEPCHRLKSNDEQSLAKRNGSSSVAKPDVISSLSENGEGMTFGLRMADPWRAHVADRIFVQAVQRSQAMEEAPGGRIGSVAI